MYLSKQYCFSHAESLSQPLSDELIGELSLQVGLKWKRLAAELELTSSDLEEIEEVCSSKDVTEDDSTMAYHMLMYWRGKTGQDSSRLALAQALKRADLDDIAVYRHFEQANSSGNTRSMY